MRERLQKLISAAGLASRREAENWISTGRVAVNGRIANLGESADLAVDVVEVDGRPLRKPDRKITLVLNKPAGYVTTLHDPQGRPVVTELVKDVPVRLFPVGRLDLNTEGLLLLSNDGHLAQHLSHPRHQVEKTYLARIRGHITEKAIDRLREGILLEDGMTDPAAVELVRRTAGHTWITMTIREGRNRQVRRMCEAVGHPVSRLKRVRLGFLELGNLPAGQYRELTPSEVSRLKKL